MQPVNYTQTTQSGQSCHSFRAVGMGYANFKMSAEDDTTRAGFTLSSTNHVCTDSSTYDGLPYPQLWSVIIKITGKLGKHRLP